MTELADASNTNTESANNRAEGVAPLVDEATFLDYLELQGSPAMITKSELLAHVREYGGPISDRQLTTYVTEGLIPKSVRVGSRAGAYPEIVGDLLVWIVEARRSGASVEAVRELLPVWRFLKKSFRGHRLDLGEFEYIVRQRVRNPEAYFNIASVLFSTVPCPHCLIENIEYVLKDGTTARHTYETPLHLGFQVGIYDEETKSARRGPHYMIMLPLPDREGDPNVITVGLPPGVNLPPLRSRGQESCEPEEVDT